MIPPQENRQNFQEDNDSDDQLSQEIFVEPLRELYKSSQSTTALIRGNLFLAELNLPKPLVKKTLEQDDQEDCLSLIRYVHKAKRGFVLCSKSSQFEKNEEPDLLKDTKIDFSDDDPYVEYPWEDLFAFHSFSGTLSQLHTHRVVTFRTFEKVDALDLGNRVEERKSFWYHHDPEFIWTLLERIERVTNELLEYPKTPEYPESDAFLIGHFLSASAHIAKEVVKSNT